MKRNAILSALSITATAAALTLSLGAPARADGGDDGYYHHDRGYRDHGRDHWRGEDEGHRNWHDGCPPGLIAAGGRCFAPGQYRRAERERHREEHRGWRRGEHLRDGDYRVLSDWREYRLPRLPYGQRYVLVNGNQVLRVDRNTMTVLAEVGLLNALLNH